MARVNSSGRNLQGQWQLEAAFDNSPNADVFIQPG
jgi:hypothetical protein